MAEQVHILPLGVELRADVEVRQRAKPYRARVRWVDPATKKRPSVSEAFETREEADEWIERIRQAAARGVDPKMATATLADYGKVSLELALRGIEPKTRDPYLAGWRRRVLPTVGHLPVTMITAGVADRAVGAWIADGCSKSTVKNTLAVWGRVMDQAVRDELIDRNPVQVTGWQRQFAQVEDELEDPRALALPDWQTLTALADALVAASADNYRGWGEVVIFAACTATRIGEVSGCRVTDIDVDDWVWTLRRQTTPGPGGMQDKGTKGKRARKIPIIAELRPLVSRRIAAIGDKPEARLFVGPRGGRISTGVLRRATHWDDVVAALGYEHLRRHGLRHTGLTWFADAGVPVHRLQKIAGHRDPRITERYLHPDIKSLQDDGNLLSQHLRSPRGPQLRVVGE
ncbi:site-specific integrase [Nocardia sp. CDC186]|uniref:Site-specific integrase n=1 Tax=Nocardia implantans TaxID=3108168 RepID=A0ABU6AZC8_9NOCA|nr:MULTISPECIES: site-specific integrase [unclassified Nocardia]MBF6194173.1 site-specific integrase [Nocardia beijingensis]MEA3529781.1 site-specific integrase [Nocardia sp. CDC192]MEB3512741.1 site-specific integrase [Nocardia sp. CDC186]